jgi:hypothetical protein
VKPLDRYVAHQLEQARLRYEQGKKSELLYWLGYCLMNNREVPEWIKKGLYKALDDAHTYKIKCWNDAFGPPVPKGKHLKTARRNYEIAWPVFDRVQELHKSDPCKWPIGESLFETVAAEFKINKTLASKLYYEVVKEIRESIDEEEALKAFPKN